MTLGTWLDIKIIMLNEISHIQKDICRNQSWCTFGFVVLLGCPGDLGSLLPHDFILCIWGMHDWPQKMVLDLPELEFQMAKNRHVGCGH